MKWKELRMKRLIFMILILMSFAKASFTVTNYSESASGGIIRFRVKNISGSAIDMAGYEIRIYGTGDTYPTTIKQQPQANSSGLVFNGKTDCGNDLYMFSGTAVSNLTIEADDCWFGSTSHCSQDMEFWLGRNGEVEMSHPGVDNIVIVDGDGNVVTGTVPVGYDTCDESTPPSSSSSSASSSSSEPVICVDSLTIHDTTIVNVYDTTFTAVNLFDTTVTPINLFDTTITPVNLFDTTTTLVDVFDTTITPVNLFDTTITPVNLFDTTITMVNLFDTTITVTPVNLFDTTITAINLFDTTITMIPLDSHYTVSIADTIRDTTWIFETTEKEAEFEVAIVGEYIQQVNLVQGTIMVPPRLTVDVSMVALNENDVVTLSYEVHTYDVIGQYVASISGSDNLDILNGTVINVFEYGIYDVDDDGNIITEDGTRIGNGAYIINARVVITVNGELANVNAIQRTIGYRR
jgi:hypothetical protein